MTRHHELTAADLAAVASGLGGPAVIGELMAIRLSRHLLLLKYVVQEWREDRQFLDTAVTTLAEVQRSRPEVFRRLLGHPLTGAWLAHTARQLRRRPGESPTGDLLQLGALAAAGAMRAGLDADLTGYARRGRLTIPGFGEARLADGADGPVSIPVRDGRALLSPAEWLPVRQLTARCADLTCTVDIEDGSAYRAGYHVPPADRLSAAEAAGWQALFSRSWELLVQHAPARAAELASGLRAVVPLHAVDPGAARSGTARDSVGALGLTRPSTPEDLALTLVHEFQHSKLSAVLDLLDLYVPGGSERHFAPWRTDPRPTAGLIQGVYAFLGIADTWRGFRAEPALREAATDHYAAAREQVHAGLTALEGSAELTPAGRRFIDGMRATLGDLLSDELPEPNVAASRATLERLRASWASRQTSERTTTAG